MTPHESPPVRRLIFALLLTPSLAPAQVTLGPTGVNPQHDALDPPDAATPPPDEPRRIRLTVTPAALPSPPLEYRLLRDPATLVPGNSVPFWYRAELVVAEQARNLAASGRDKPLGTAAAELLDEPAGSLTPRRIEEALGSDPENWPLFDQTDTAASRTDTRWGWGFEQMTGPESIEFLLPEIQNARSLAWLIAARARVRLDRGDRDGALADVAVGMRLARDVSEPPLLICDLVAIAIGTILLDGPVTDLIDTPGSPNLYHALSVLPDPLVDVRRSLAWELGLPFRVAPWLGEAETLDWPADRWRRELVELQRTVGGYTGFGQETDAATEAAAVLRMAAALPAARRALIEGGMDAERVDAMPAGQVLAVREQRFVEEYAQRYLAAAAPGGPAALAALREVDDELKRAGRNRGLVMSTTTLLPAVAQAFNAQQRLVTRVNALRVVEAIRLHVARTGALPESLDAITAVPVPGNALSGAPFPYRLEDGTAELEVTVQPGVASTNWVYEVRLEN